MVAQALEEAAERWPAERDHRGRLLVKLIEAGHRALSERDERQVTRRKEALARTRGVLTGVYGPGYLEEMRGDWPA